MDIVDNAVDRGAHSMVVLVTEVFDCFQWQAELNLLVRWVCCQSDCYPLCCPLIIMKGLMDCNN